MQADLPPLPERADGHHAEIHVVDAPDERHRDHVAEFHLRPEARDAGERRRDVEAQQPEEHERERVQLLRAHAHALGRHLERGLVRMAQGGEDRGGQEHRLHALVDLREERPAHLAEEEVRDDESREHEGERVRDDLRRRGVVDRQAEDEEGTRCEEVDHARDAEEPEEAAVEVAQALREREPRHEERVVQDEDLHHALRPARVLQHVVGVRLGREAAHHRVVHVHAVVAAPVQLERGLRVLGDGLARHAAHFHEVRAPHHRRRAAEVAGAPRVEARLDDAVEHLALVGHRRAAAHGGLGRRRVHEEVRRLHQEDLRIGDEVAQRALQDLRGGHVVAVEEEDEVALRAVKRVVQVPGLGGTIGLARHVGRAHLGRDLLQPVAALPHRVATLGMRALLHRAAVVADVDAQQVPRIVDLRRGERGELHDVRILVVGRDQDVHRRPRHAVLRHVHRLAIERPHVHEESQQVQRDRVHLGAEQQRHADEVRRVGVDERLEAAPPQIAQREVGRHQHEHQAPGVAPRRGKAPDGEHEHHARPAGDELQHLAEVRLAQVHHVEHREARGDEREGAARHARELVADAPRQREPLDVDRLVSGYRRVHAPTDRPACRLRRRHVWAGHVARARRRRLWWKWIPRRAPSSRPPLARACCGGGTRARAPCLFEIDDVGAGGFLVVEDRAAPARLAWRGGALRVGAGGRERGGRGECARNAARRG